MFDTILKILACFLACLKIVYLFFPEGFLHNSQMKVEKGVGFFNTIVKLVCRQKHEQSAWLIRSSYFHIFKKRT